MPGVFLSLFSCVQYHAVLIQWLSCCCRFYEGGLEAYEETNSMLKRGDIIGVTGCPGELCCTVMSLSPV